MSDSGFHTVPQLVLARALGCWVVYDKFIPLYERHVEDRSEFRRWSPKALTLALYDIVTCWLGNVVIADTQAHCRYLARLSMRSESHFFACLPASLGEDLPECEPEEHDSPVVFWCGSGQGFHGADVVARVAVELARTGTASTTLIGPASVMEPIVHDWIGRGVTLHDRTEFSEVWRRLCAADVVLGAFGHSPKGERVVPYKVLDAACAGKPVVTRESVALREHLPGVLIFAPPDTDAIVSTIRAVLADDPRAAGAALRAYYHEHLDAPSVARAVLDRAVPAAWGVA